MPAPLFRMPVDRAFSAAEKEELARDGHVVLPNLLTDDTSQNVREALRRIHDITRSDPDLRAFHKLERELHRLRGSGRRDEASRARLRELLAGTRALQAKIGYRPGQVCGEVDAYLREVIGHGQMLGLARAVLGGDIRFDHMVSLVKEGGHPGQDWHSHEYASGSRVFHVPSASSDEDQKASFAQGGGAGSRAGEVVTPDRPDLGFIRIFFYVDGFAKGDGSLSVVRGSHHYRLHEVLPGRQLVPSDAMEREWLPLHPAHPVTGERSAIEDLECPPNSVVIMWTHALHAVAPRKASSGTRHCVVTAFRNPGAPSVSRWISAAFAARRSPGLTPRMKSLL